MLVLLVHSATCWVRNDWVDLSAVTVELSAENWVSNVARKAACSVAILLNCAVFAVCCVVRSALYPASESGLVGSLTADDRL